MKKGKIGSRLGSAVKRAKKASQSGLPSLISIIDKELTKPKEKFSFKEIKELASQLSSFCEEATAYKSGHKHDAARKGVMGLLLRIVHAGFLSYEGSGDSYLHPSSFGSDCNRKVFYEVSGFPVSNPKKPNPPKLERIFDLGTLIHMYLQSVLLKEGTLLEAEAKVVDESLRINGRLDGSMLFPGVKEKVVLEIKSINSRGFQNAKQGPLSHHIEQALTYAKKSGYSYVYFLYFNKDTSDLAEHILEVDKYERLWNRLEKKYVSVNKAIDEKSPPERECVTYSDGLERDCPFRDLCFKKGKYAEKKSVGLKRKPIIKKSGLKKKISIRRN